MLDFVVVIVSTAALGGPPDAAAAGRHLGDAPAPTLACERRAYRDVGACQRRAAHRDLGACEQATAALAPPQERKLVCVLAGAVLDQTAPTAY